MSNALIIYSLLSFLFLFICAKLSYKLNLVDFPNKRKIHSKPTAYTGGIAISSAFVLSILILEISDNYLNLILSMAFLISIVGLIDDKFSLNVGGKLSLQIIPIFYLVFFENFFLKDLGDYNYFKLELGAFVMPFSLICVLFLINAFNYFDGLDGTLSFTSISVLAILYFLAPNQNFQLFLIIIFIPLGIFLCFNFNVFKFPKMFLGDSGSLLIGFVISFILIYLANRNFIHPIVLAWSIVIFVYEFLSINIIRIKNNKNPFKAGQDHLHHILFKKTKSIFLTNFFISITNIILFIGGYSCFLLISPYSSLLLFVVLFIFFVILREKISK
ncbi:undecaprenyl/decaprenyl-phosphate alpha-N-acetylglucosaminyl 1-phosphate transferase [Candidatus Pelagibacter bacterium]|nr:undecaprenyl/decaprenyl-phosphate alpha-N-acetylglucosaminyl 1-phosphate transferase [Candidatus Pelagibacter bacterium]